jgi:hypothetical protein
MAVKEEETIVAFHTPRERIVPVTHFRGTWLTSSVQALRKRDLFDRYVALVAPADRDPIVYCAAVSWVPTELVVRHYDACEQLALPTETLLEIGTEVTQRVHASSLALGRSVANASGVTPWSILGRVDKLWSRAVMGGAVGVAKTGPKDARVELLGFPVSHLRYNRIATRGIIHGMIALFASSVWVSEIAQLCTPTSLAYRAQWV